MTPYDASIMLMGFVRCGLLPHLRNLLDGYFGSLIRAGHRTLPEYWQEHDQGGARAVHSCGPANIASPHGGIFFYGIHQGDAVVELLGCEAEEVACHVSGRNAVGVILFSGGRSATLQLIEEGDPHFHWTAHLNGGASLSHPDLSDPDPYLSSAGLIHGLLSRGEVPFSTQRMLAPIAILEAFSRALVSGKPERVESV